MTFHGRILWLLFFLFIRNFQAQIYEIRCAFISGENLVVISQNFPSSESKNDSKIYISFNAHFSNLGSDYNYEVVKINLLKNNKTAS